SLTPCFSKVTSVRANAANPLQRFTRLLLGSIFASIRVIRGQFFFFGCPECRTSFVVEVKVGQLTENEINIMKSKLTSVCATLLLAGSICLIADEPAKQKPGSPEFERMKSLIGTWKGRTDMGQ